MNAPTTTLSKCEGLEPQFLECGLCRSQIEDHAADVVKVCGAELWSGPPMMVGAVCRQAIE